MWLARISLGLTPPLWTHENILLFVLTNENREFLPGPLQHAARPLHDECLAGECHSQEEDDHDNDAGGHEVSEAGL